jgi:hypothetical protein
VSSNGVGAQTAKAIKIIFCTHKATTLSWYIGYDFSWFETGGCLSEKISVFAKNRKILDFRKKN